MPPTFTNSTTLFVHENSLVCSFLMSIKIVSSINGKFSQITTLIFLLIYTYHLSTFSLSLSHCTHSLFPLLFYSLFLLLTTYHKYICRSPIRLFLVYDIIKEWNVKEKSKNKIWETRREGVQIKLISLRPIIDVTLSFLVCPTKDVIFLCDRDL